MVNYVQIMMEGTKLDTYMTKCIESVKALVNEAEGDTYTMKQYTNKKTIGDTIDTSDLMRLELASVDPNMCYVDLDCFVCANLDIQSNSGTTKLPILCRDGIDHNTKIPDIYLFYVNGGTDLFKKLLISAKTKERNTYSLDRKCLSSLRENIDFSFFKNELSYIHRYTTMREVSVINTIDTLRDKMKKYDLFYGQVQTLSIALQQNLKLFETTMMKQG
jgi:hypothetical protein